MKNLFLLTIGALFLLNCSSQENLNIYSARHYDVDQMLYEEFREQTGININLIEGGSDELIERIKSEGINSPADIIITVDAGRIWRAEESEILSSVNSSILNENIPATYRHPDGLWFGLSKRVRGLVVNPETVENVESITYADLASPEFEGRVCIRSSNNIYNQSLVAAMIARIGAEETEKWVNGLVKNFARDPQGGDRDQIKAVAAGVCDVAVVNHYYFALLAESEDAADQDAVSKVKFVFPDQMEGEGGVHVNISAAAVLENAPNIDNAIRFLEYLTTDSAQNYFTEQNNEYPVNEGTELSELLQSFGEYRGEAINVSELGTNNPEAILIMDRAGWK